MMIIFVYTFVTVFIALVMIIGVGSLLAGKEEPVKPEMGRATAAMCTTRLLGDYSENEYPAEEDFVIEQDMVYTYANISSKKYRHWYFKMIYLLHKLLSICFD